MGTTQLVCAHARPALFLCCTRTRPFFFLRRYVDTAFGTLVLVSPVWRTDHNAVGDHKLFAAMVAMIDFSCAHATLTRVVAERADIVIGCNGLEAEHVAF